MTEIEKLRAELCTAKTEVATLKILLREAEEMHSILSKTAQKRYTSNRCELCAMREAPMVIRGSYT